MSVKHNLEQWIAQLDYDDTCDISDRQVSELIRNYAALESRCAEQDEKLRMINELTGAVEQVNKLAQEATERLIKERNALAAENAALKAVESNLVRNIINDLGDTEFQYEKVQTPATAAFLAEVRAQGVEMFATELGNVHKQLRSGSNHAHAIKSAVFRAVEFAAQLRK